MKNILLLNDERHQIKVEEGSTKSGVIGAFSNDLCFVLMKESNLLVASTAEGAIWSAALLIEERKREWLYAAYIGECDGLVCVAADGEIMCVDCQSQEITIVGVVDGGVIAASQSPDEELLLIFTRDGNLLCMTSDFEVMNEVPLPHPLLAGAQASLPSISWRGDCQYFSVLADEESDVIPGGNTSKCVRVYSKEDLSSHAVGRHEDDSPVVGLGSAIAWSTDGSLIAATQESKGKLQVVFFERNGLRHREFILRDMDLSCDVVDFLSWNVESTMLAVGINHTGGGGRGRIQLWHRNNYHWYMKYEEYVREDQKISSLGFDKEEANRLNAILSSSSTPGQEDKGGGKLEWCSFEFCWDVNVSETRLRTAAVIDGRQLGLTSLGTCIVPPPMSKAVIHTQAAIKAVAFSPMLSSSASVTETSLLACLTSNGTIEIYKESQAAAEGAHLCSFELTGREDESLRRNARQLVMLEDGEMTDRSFSVLLVYWDAKQETDVLVEVFFAKGSGPMTLLSPEKMTSKYLPVDGRVLRLAGWGGEGHHSALVELSDGAIMRYRTGGQLTPLIPGQHQVLLEPCPWVRIVQLGSSSEVDPSACDMVLGLSERSRLYFGEHLLCGAVSSFVVSYSFAMVIYVTLGSRPELRFVSFKELRTLDVMAGSEGGIVQGLEARALERGAYVISALLFSPTVVVQVPRGNLEAVCPRALVMYSVCRLLDVGRYGQAFSLLRRHNADMNLLVDYNPDHFQEHVETFVQQVARTDHLNVFISSLHCNDCTLGKDPCLMADEHDQQGKGSRPLPSWFPSDKRNRVCELVRGALEARRSSDPTSTASSPSILEPILTTWARQCPPKFEDALDLIRREIKGTRKEKLSSEYAQRLIKYLAFFTDMDSLFDTALGMYDMDLARAVARQSQKDPREYLPLLERLQSMEPWRGRVAIDIQLKRPAHALVHMAERSIAEVDEHQVCEMVSQAELHEIALRLFSRDRFQNLHSQILTMFAEQLMTKGEYREAMVAFLSNHPPNLLRAAEATRALGDWRTTLNLISRWEAINKSTYEKDTSNTLVVWAKQLAQQNLEAVGSDRRDRLKDAAVIYIDYLHDVEGALAALIASSAWSEALRVSWREGRSDLADIDIKNAVLEASEALQGDLEGWTISYGHLRKELIDVLEKIKLQDDELAEAERTRQLDKDDASLFSAATHDTLASVASYRSASTTASHATCHSRLTWSSGTTSNGSIVSNAGRRERRLAKKKPKKVKRTLREEEAHIRSKMEKLLPQQEVLRDVRDLLDTLVFFAELDQARALFESVKDYLDFCTTHPIPPPPAASHSKGDLVAVTNTKANGKEREEEKEVTRSQEMGTLIVADFAFLFDGGSRER